MIAKDLVIRAPNIKFFDDMVQYSRSVVKHVNGTSAFEDRGGAAQNILNFMQIFGKIGKVVLWRSSPRVGTPSYEESSIRLCSG